MRKGALLQREACPERRFLPQKPETVENLQQLGVWSMLLLQASRRGEASFRGPA